MPFFFFMYLFGATSMVGWSVYKAAPQRVVPFCNLNTKISACDSWNRLNVENQDQLTTIFRNDSPEILIHCAGICDVEKCGKSPEWTHSINVESIHSLLAVLPRKTRLVYCSTDHVFGSDGIYAENSMPCPISVYGRSKQEAEKIIRQKKPDALIIRYGLPIGPSIDNRSGHLDWLLYRNKKGLPITIIQGECRSAVWAEALAHRILALAKSSITGVRHIQATRVVSRVTLANYLIRKYKINPQYRIVNRDQLDRPHLGSIELKTEYRDELSRPLPSVLD